MYVCVCKAITEGQVRQAIDQGADYKALRENFGIGTDCGQCGSSCKKMLTQAKHGCSFYEVTA